ncbi:bifunctional riboflavin kinase/FAD synthetase [Chloroflexota bacterium]
MQIEEELSELSPSRETLLTIGVFDGVHLGHKYLISKLIEQARQNNLLSGVVTFRQHPQEVVSTRVKLSFLTDPEERRGLLKAEGVDIVVLLSFTAELARLSPREFVGLLQKCLRMRGLVIGPDFALGKDREGDADILSELGKEKGFSVTVVPPVMINGEVASSTVVRKAVSEGDMKKVTELTGRPFSLHGRVVDGGGRGAGLGFPTANLDINQEHVLPNEGVYASWAYVDGREYQSLTNIGICPTFGGSECVAEVYLVDYRGDLYGRELKVNIMDRLRDEVKFNSAEELKQQIARDVKQGRAILETRGGI